MLISLASIVCKTWSPQWPILSIRSCKSRCSVDAIMCEMSTAKWWSRHAPASTEVLPTDEVDMVFVFWHRRLDWVGTSANQIIFTVIASQPMCLELWHKWLTVMYNVLQEVTRSSGSKWHCTLQLLQNKSVRPYMGSSNKLSAISFFSVL